MEQHPIPQQISSYQFRLVGDMTLKQFFQLAGGIVGGLIFYSSPLLPIIKWPFAIVSVILGVALAFLPLEERPLEKWIFAFFRAIYAPTLYYWKKTTTPIKFFQDETEETKSTQTEAATQLYAGAQKGVLQKLDQEESGFLSKLSGIFSGITSTLSGTTNVSSTPSSSPVPAVAVSAPIPPVSSPQPVAPKPQVTQIPVTQPIKVVVPTQPKLVLEEQKAPVSTQSFSSSGVSPVIAGNEFISTRQAIFSPMAAPPSVPSIPNIAVGQVVDQERKIVEGAIMEIRDTAGRPVRALRSNKLGHFVIVTPLENGKYEIVTEKDGYEFTPVSFEATGQIIPPILVSGKNLHPEIL